MDDNKPLSMSTLLSRHGDDVQGYESPDLTSTSSFPSLPSHDDTCLEPRNCLTLGLGHEPDFGESERTTYDSLALHRRNHSVSAFSRIPPAAQFTYGAGAFSSRMSSQPRLAPHQQLQPNAIDYANQVWNYTPSGAASMTISPEIDALSEDVSSNCSGGCDIGGACDDSSCVDEATACTDQHCEVDAEHSEENRAASVLARLNHGQNPMISPDFSSPSLGMLPTSYPLMSSTTPAFDHNHEAFMDALGPSVEHALLSHDDPLSAVACGAQCPLLTLSDLDYCHFAVDHEWDHFCATAQHAHQPTHECGFRADNPAAWIDHVQTEHPAFFSNLQLNLDGTHHISMLGSLHGSTPDLMSDSVGLTPGSEIATPRVSMSPLQPMGMDVDVGGTGTDCSVLKGSKKVDIAKVFVPQVACRCYWKGANGEERCHRDFGSTDELQQHVLKDHVKIVSRAQQGFMCEWLDCSRCDKGFPQRSKLERHVQTHTGAKPFECDICHEFFSAKQALDQHKLRHTEKKPEQCHICGAYFRQKSALTMHIRTHTGERPLECPICGKTFTESSNLSKHKRTHELEGRYKCRFGCGKSFHRHDQQLRHEKRHKGLPAAQTQAPTSAPAQGLVPTM